jgi:hypothetical protein
MKYYDLLRYAKIPWILSVADRANVRLTATVGKEGNNKKPHNALVISQRTKGAGNISKACCGKKIAKVIKTKMVSMYKC